MKKFIFLSLVLFTIMSCSKDDDQPVAGKITLQFTNQFKNTPLVLGGADAASATVNTSAEGQVHHFSDLKYVISNIRLISKEGIEFPYHVNDLDQGATVIDQSNPSSLEYVLSQIPAGEYKQLKFGLGVPQALNTLDQVRFPAFYAKADANDTEMMWEWGTGYRFTKIEGFYGSNNEPLSIHTGSTIEGDEGDYTQGVDAYREITLELSSPAVVNGQGSRIVILADFDNLLSGKTHTLVLGAGNATPNVHSAVEMVKFVDNLGGNASSDLTGIFSIGRVEN